MYHADFILQALPWRAPDCALQRDYNG